MTVLDPASQKTLQEQIDEIRFSPADRLFRLSLENRIEIDPGRDREAFAKSVTTTGIDTTNAMYRVEVASPAALVFPTDAPIETDAILDTQVGGNAISYVTVDSRQAGGQYIYSGGVKPGNRAAAMQLSSTLRSKVFATMGMEIPIAQEALNASKGSPAFDVSATGLAIMTSAFKEILEIQNIGGFASAVAPAPTFSITPSGTGGALPAGTYNIGVAGLTLEGYFNTVTVPGAVALPTSQTITTAAGKSYVQNGGSTALSAYTSTGALSGTTSSVVATVTSWPAGIVAFGWVIGAPGSEKVAAVTTLGTYTFTALAASGNQAVAAAGITTTNDYSKNQYGYDGLLAQIDSNVSIGATVYDCAGSGFTVTNGRSDQLDAIFLSMYNGSATNNAPAANRLGPDVIYFNALDMLNFTKKMGASGANNLVRWNIDISGDNPVITAGMVIGWYTNTFTGKAAKLVTHPFCPQGHFFGYTLRLPANYVLSGLLSSWKIVQNDPIHAIDWVATDRSVYRGMYTGRGLVMEAPRAGFHARNLANV